MLNESLFPCSVTGRGLFHDNESLNCDVIYEKFLIENLLLFGDYHRARVSVTCVLFLVSCIGNLLGLLSVTMWRNNHELTHPQLLIIHLSTANLAFTIFILPMDGIWHITLQWLAGDIMCRIMNMLKQFSMYVSSSVIMVISIDRVVNLLSHVSSKHQLVRSKRLLLAAWIFSLANSLPALIMFSVQRHRVEFECNCPEHVVVQCVDFTLVDGVGRRIFYFYTMVISFFIPLLTTIICYIIIAITIAKMAKKSQETRIQSSGFRARKDRKGLAQQSLDRAKHISQLNTGLITAVFIICWGPYYVAGLRQWFGGDEYKPIPLIHLVMLMTQYLNPCLHPLITAILVKEVRNNIKCKRKISLKNIRSSWNTAKRRQNQLTTKEKDSKQIPLLEAQPKPQRALRHKAVEV